MVCIMSAAFPLAAQGQARSIPSAGHPVRTEEALRGFDEFVYRVLQEWAAPGAAVAVVRNGALVHAQGYGVRDPETGAPMTARTLFPIGSITKSFTSFGAGLLVDEGHLQLDAPVRRVLPGFDIGNPVGTWEISMRDLLSHRSGFGSHDFVWEDPALTREELLRRLPELGLSSAIRTRWQYSNLGYAIAAHALETVAGVPWERFTSERIFQPLGMTRTMWRGQAAQDADRMKGVVWWQGRYVVADWPEQSEASHPGGGIHSTAEDLTRWVLLHLAGGASGTDRLIESETLQQMHGIASPESSIFRPDPDYRALGYGLGWFVHTYRGEPLLMHGGAGWGYGTAVGLLPELELGVVVLVNQDFTQLPWVIMRTLFDRFMGAPQRDWSGELLSPHLERLAAQDGYPQRQAAGRIGGTSPSRPLGEYVGTYTHPAYGTVDVSLVAGELRIRSLGEDARLEHWHHDIFAAESPLHTGIWAPEGWRTRVSFIGSIAGEIAEIRLSRTPGITFTKQPR
jgi:CubicO group peptidase (beta-lactamase class C family)